VNEESHTEGRNTHLLSLDFAPDAVCRWPRWGFLPLKGL